MEKAALPHMVQLDSVRCLAVSAVLVHHFLPGSTRIAPFGAMGVKLFFVLSGFLITGILLGCRNSAGDDRKSSFLAVRRFYARRFLRIFPLFYFVLIVTAILNVYPAREIFFWNVGYLSNLYIAATNDWPGPFSPFWTLAVEEQFYLVWPWVILFVPRTRLLAVIVAAITLAPVFRGASLLAGLTPSSVGVLPFACLDTLGLGALLALFSQKDGAYAPFHDRFVAIAKWAGIPALTIILIASAAGSAHVLTFVGLDLAMGLSAVWFVARASTGFNGLAGRLLDLKPLVYVGTVSYGVYVYHSFVGDLGNRVFNAALSGEKSGLLTAAIGAAGVGIIGVAVMNRSRIMSKMLDEIKPLIWVVGFGAVVILAVYGLMRIRLLPLDSMNHVVYFIVASIAAVGVASVSWHLLERPINNLKRHFEYQEGQGGRVAVVDQSLTNATCPS